MMVCLSSHEAREVTMGYGPLFFNGHTITLERPELAENRVG
jgi:hypothetical protein